MTGIGVAATAHYLPERWMTAAEVGEASGIAEDVIVEKFGLRGKHVAAEDEHVSDLAVEAASRLLAEHDVDPASIGAVLYYGSTWKDYAVWQAAPWIAHRLGCTSAFALEYDQVSMGTPVALRFARALLAAEPELRTVLLVAACRESYLLDYGNERSRFMFNFGDGAVAGLLTTGADRNLLLGSHTLTDGSFSLQVKVPAGGSVEPASHGERRRAASLPRRRRPRADEGRPRRGVAAELRRRRRGRARAERGDGRRRVVPLRHPHEALDARGDRRRARPVRSTVPRTSTTRVT